mmetsp:Transcript_28194/g.58839  ORF Transcript_28194/g.58839 Transcript_28194/m.58839 type:complete len:143 (+) Transcript_28194:540-968(+)
MTFKEYACQSQEMGTIVIQLCTHVSERFFTGLKQPLPIPHDHPFEAACAFPCLFGSQTHTECPSSYLLAIFFSLYVQTDNKIAAVFQTEKIVLCIDKQHQICYQQLHGLMHAWCYTADCCSYICLLRERVYHPEILPAARER